MDRNVYYGTPKWEDFTRGDVRIRANPELIRRYGHDKLVLLVQAAQPRLDTLPVKSQGDPGKVKTVDARLHDGVAVAIWRAQFKNVPEPVCFIDTIERLDNWISPHTN